MARARGLAERAYFLFPSPEAADTLGWALVRSGEPQRALPLLREAVAARRVGNPAQPGAAPAGPDPGMTYRLAFALMRPGTGPRRCGCWSRSLAGGGAFTEKAEAERLLATLRAGR